MVWSALVTDPHCTARRNASRCSGRSHIPGRGTGISNRSRTARPGSISQITFFDAPRSSSPIDRNVMTLSLRGLSGSTVRSTPVTTHAVPRTRTGSPICGMRMCVSVMSCSWKYRSRSGDVRRTRSTSQGSREWFWVRGWMGSRFWACPACWRAVASRLSVTALNQPRQLDQLGEDVWADSGDAQATSIRVTRSGRIVILDDPVSHVGRSTPHGQRRPVCPR